MVHALQVGVLFGRRMVEELTGTPHEDVQELRLVDAFVPRSERGEVKVQDLVMMERVRFQKFLVRHMMAIRRSLDSRLQRREVVLEGVGPWPCTPSSSGTGCPRAQTCNSFIDLGLGWIVSLTPCGTAHTTCERE